MDELQYDAILGKVRKQSKQKSFLPREVYTPGMNKRQQVEYKQRVILVV